jgi:hypothetical protein
MGSGQSKNLLDGLSGPAKAIIMGRKARREQHIKYSGMYEAQKEP